MYYEDTCGHSAKPCNLCVHVIYVERFKILPFDCIMCLYNMLTHIRFYIVTIVRYVAIFSFTMPFFQVVFFGCRGDVPGH